MKYPTGAAKKHEAIWRDGHILGVCRAPGWMVIHGPYAIKATGIDMQVVRADHMRRARLKRRPGSQRNLRYHNA